MLGDMDRTRQPQEGPAEILMLPPPSDPMRVAKQLLEAYAVSKAEGQLTLRSWRGGWLAWRGTHWAEAETAEIRAWAYQVTKDAAYVEPKKAKKNADTDGEEAEDEEEPKIRPWSPNRHKIADLLQAIEAHTHLSEGISPPVWLDGQPPFTGPMVSCANGLLPVRELILQPHTPRFFNLVSVPFAYDPYAPQPRLWLWFLKALWPDDDAAIATLQEWFGYVLSGRIDLDKILLLIGPPRSGKGTIARVLTALIGALNVAGPTLSSLGAQFGLMPLLGKPLAVVSDARLGGPGTRQVVERLLSVSGEDFLTVDRKYREPWTGQLPTRFMILSNELPEFGDASGAIANRFITLILSQAWLGQEDTELTAKLRIELPCILNWALAGLARVAQQGRITVPASSDDVVADLQDLTSPISAFIRERCQPGGEVDVEDLFTAWRSWCFDNGHSSRTKQQFGRDLRAARPGLKMTRPREDGGRKRYYLGLSLPTTDHNGEARGPARTGAAGHDVVRDGENAFPQANNVVRDGPRQNPLWPVVGDGPRSIGGQPGEDFGEMWRQWQRSQDDLPR